MTSALRRARRAVDGWRGAALPGTASADPLRVILRFAHGRTAEYSDNPSDLPRSGPGVTDATVLALTGYELSACSQGVTSSRCA